MSHEKLEGTSVEASDDATLERVLGKATDYRGDVTLHLRDGRTIECFVYHRDFSCAEPFLEYFPAEEGSAKARLSCRDVAGVSFSGRDTADGKSWEAWVAKNAAEK